MTCYLLIEASQTAWAIPECEFPKFAPTPWLSLQKYARINVYKTSVFKRVGSPRNARNGMA
jgi:hypothetical protein